MILVAIAGGFGASLRLVTDGVLRSLAGSRLPWGTLLINIAGSAGLGLLLGFSPGPREIAVVGTGLLVAIGAAVAMGASPAPSSSGGSPQTVPGQGNGGPGNGRFDPFAGFGGLGPLGAGAPGKPFGGPGAVTGRGFGDIKVTAADSLVVRSGAALTATATSTKLSSGAPTTCQGSQIEIGP